VFFTENIIEEIYCGGLEAQTCANGENSAVLRELASRMSLKSESFLTAESEKCRRLLWDEYCDISEEYISVSNRDSFVQGFRCGARIISEIFREKG